MLNVDLNAKKDRNIKTEVEKTQIKFNGNKVFKQMLNSHFEQSSLKKWGAEKKKWKKYPLKDSLGLNNNT